MYFSNKNNFFHGLLFHHFHDDNIHKKSQGSIDKDQFYKLLKFVGTENILDANEFINRFQERKLEKNNVCITFDDSIRCQYDVALPILEELKIKAFFFSYSSLFEDEPDLFEIYRFFRTNFFKDMNEFYESFFFEVNEDLSNFFKKKKNDMLNFKKTFPFHTMNDIKFIYVRDEFLSRENYQKIMKEMFLKKNFKTSEHYKNLFMSKNHIIKLNELGHNIGLHSHTHPTLIEGLSYDEQEDEYGKNITILSNIINCKKNDIKTMAHPCGSYNENTKKILNNLNINIGFRSNMSIDTNKKMEKINNSSLEIAREDHANIMKMI